MIAVDSVSAGNPARPDFLVRAAGTREPEFGRRGDGGQVFVFKDLERADHVTG